MHSAEHQLSLSWDDGTEQDWMEIVGIVNKYSSGWYD